MTQGKYKGILAEPRPQISILTSLDENQIAEHTTACMARDDALFAKYSIDRADGDSWQQLAFALAEEHVPAYKIKKRGKPPRNLDENVSILIRWEATKRTKNCSDAEAGRMVANELGMDERTVAERIKKFKRSEIKAIIEFIKNVEMAIGTEKMAGILTSKDGSDERLQRYIDRRLMELYRPPYK